MYFFYQAKRLKVSCKQFVSEVFNLSHTLTTSWGGMVLICQFILFIQVVVYWQGKKYICGNILKLHIVIKKMLVVNHNDNNSQRGGFTMCWYIVSCGNLADICPGLMRKELQLSLPSVKQAKEAREGRSDLPETAQPVGGWFGLCCR